MIIQGPVARCKSLSPGAKLIYGRLNQYTGKNGLIYPSIPTLANEVGLGERQTWSHIKQLEAEGFIRRCHFGNRNGRCYEFLEHPVFATARPDDFRFPQPNLQETASLNLQDTAREYTNLVFEKDTDTDNAPRNRKNRDSEEHRLERALMDYMHDDVPPSESLVRDILEFSGGTVDEIIDSVLPYLKRRGFLPGRAKGPRQYLWFFRTISSYFKKREDLREMVSPERSMPAARPQPLAVVPDFLECEDDFALVN